MAHGTHGKIFDRRERSERRAEGGGLAHGTHGTHGRIFDRRERSDRRTEIGREEAQRAQESVG